MARLASDIVLLSALLCGTAAVSAWQEVGPDQVQTTSGPYVPGGSFAFRVDTKLVETPVVVRDGRRHAVEGLRKQDFEVYDSGRKQQIATFTVQGSSQAGTPPAAASEPGETANSAARVEKPADPRYIAFVLDDENMGFDNLTLDGLSRAVDAGVRFVQEGLSTGDRAVVFSLSQGPVSPLTADASTLIAAMKSLRIHRRLQPPTRLTGCLLPYTAYVGATRGGAGFGPAPAQSRVTAGGRRPLPPKGVGAQMYTAMAEALWSEVQSNSQRLLEMLGDIVDYMGKMPGRRMVLVASPGFQTGTLETETAALIDHAVRAGVVVNSMDVTGLWAGPTGAECSPGWAMGPQMQQAADEVLSNLASGTGGRFFHNNNDLFQAFRELGAPPEVSYLLAFAPDNAQDGRFHKLRVEVETANRYDVQARPGYFAPTPDKKRSGQEQAIDRAVLAGDTRNEIPARVTVLTGGVNAVPAIRAVAHLDVAKLKFQRVEDRRVQNLTMVAALFDTNGNFIVGKKGVISFSMTDSSFTALSKEGVNCTLTLFAPSGSYRLRTVVMDSATGRIVASNELVNPW